MGHNNPPSLAICIATRNRSSFLEQTLLNILKVASGRVDIVVVDGASTDNTGDVVRAIAARHSRVQYFFEAINSGVDGDYEKAVTYSRADYCWLLSDDDLLEAGAIDYVLDSIERNGCPQVVVVNAQVRTADMAQQLASSRLCFTEDRIYSSKTALRFFEDCAEHLTFIGAAIVRRDVWQSRERAAFFGSEFVHVGVIFQAPLESMVAIGRPLVMIRYGVGNWTRRAFDVWIIKWPRLIWSFDWIPPDTRRAIVSDRPWTNWRRMIAFRARGWFSHTEYLRLRKEVPLSPSETLALFSIAVAPGYILNRSLLAWTRLRSGKRAGSGYDLERSPFARSLLSRFRRKPLK